MLTTVIFFSFGTTVRKRMVRRAADVNSLRLLLTFPSQPLVMRSEFLTKH
jgi:hypothetical protein